MYATLLGVLAGCGGGADYTLSLSPVVAVPQEPFGGVDRLDLVLRGADGEETRVTLGEPLSGDTPSVGGLPALKDTRIAVEGYFGDELVMRGLTEPLTASHGKVATDVFVAETENAAWFDEFPDGIYHPMVAALGGGRFWVGGGMATKALSGLPEKGQSSTWELTLAPPEDGLGFVETGTLPSYVDADGTSQEERAYAGFTPLSVAGSDQGAWLVTGGATANPYLHGGQSTSAASLFDPTTGDWEDLPELSDPRCLHLAVENAIGNVVIWGGWGEASGRSITIMRTMEFYDRESRSFNVVDGTATIGFLGAAAADLGTDGTLLCGGYDYSGESDWATHTECVRVPIDGSTMESASDLPESLAGSAMLTLDDGRILLTGGVSMATAGADGDPVPARSNAWLYNPSTSTWGSLSASMTVARTGHKMALLADGRVLIAGGAQSFAPSLYPDDPVSCLEVYDPESGRFEAINDCTEADDSAGLPSRSWDPDVVVDPDYGALIVGGIAADGTAVGAVSLFVPGN